MIHANSLAAAESGLALAVIDFAPGPGVIVSEFVPGITLSVDMIKADKATLLPRFVGKVAALENLGRAG